MTMGQAWQFRPYKWNEQRQLFHNGNVFFLPVHRLFEEGADDLWVIMKGIYVSWSNNPPNTKIKDWNVTELKVRPPSPIISSFNLLFRTRTDRP